MPTRRHRLFADVQARLDDGHALDEVGRWLAEQGCDAREIDEIFARLRRHVDGDAVLPAAHPPAGDSSGRPPVAPGEPPPLRVQGPHERGRFSAEAWGWVLECAATGVIASADLETLIDRALFHHDGRIGVSDLRTLAEEAGLLPVSGDARTISH